MIKIIPMQRIQTETEWGCVRSDLEKIVSIQDDKLEEIVMLAHEMLQGLNTSYHEIGIQGNGFGFTIDRNGQISGFVDVIEVQEDNE